MYNMGRLTFDMLKVSLYLCVMFSSDSSEEFFYGKIIVFVKGGKEHDKSNF